MATPAAVLSSALVRGGGQPVSDLDLVGFLTNLSSPLGLWAAASLVILISGLLLRRSITSAVRPSPLVERHVVVAWTRVVSWATAAALATAALALLAPAGIPGALLGSALMLSTALLLRDHIQDVIAGLALAHDLRVSADPTLEVDGIPLRIQRIGANHCSLAAPDGRAFLVRNRQLAAMPVRAVNSDDAACRVRASIRISLKCDVDQVQQVLLAAALGVPDCLGSPAPRVLLAGIDTSGYEFAVDAYVSPLAESDVIASQIRLALVHAVQSRGFQLAHTQHDVHLRDLDALKTAFALAMEERRRSQQRQQ